MRVVFSWKWLHFWSSQRIDSRIILAFLYNEKIESHLEVHSTGIFGSVPLFSVLLNMKLIRPRAKLRANRRPKLSAYLAQWSFHTVCLEVDQRPSPSQRLYTKNAVLVNVPAIINHRCEAGVTALIILRSHLYRLCYVGMCAKESALRKSICLFNRKPIQAQLAQDCGCPPWRSQLGSCPAVRSSLHPKGSLSRRWKRVHGLPRPA